LSERRCVLARPSQRELARQEEHRRFAALVEAAHREGLIRVFTRFALVDAERPEGWRVNPLSNGSIGGEVCGFAWIVVKGNTRFGRWAKKHCGWGEKGGPAINFVALFGQSQRRKETYAIAYAEVLRNAGIEAEVVSRID